MSWILAALITFGSMALLCSHFSPRSMRRLMGYAMVLDFLIHGTISWVFLGTSTLGLLQAEAAGILFSLSFRVYRWLFGYERFSFNEWRWVRYAGVLTRVAR